MTGINGIVGFMGLGILNSFGFPLWRGRLCDLEFLAPIGEMFINRKILSKNENNSNLLQRAIVIELATVVI